MELSAMVLGGALLLAAVVGILTGIFGVGGGFLLTPALMVFLRVPGAVAVGTGLVVILITSWVGLHRRRGTGTVDVRLALVGSVGSLAGVALGQFLLECAKGLPPVHVGGRAQAALEFWLLWAFMGLLAWIAVLLYADYRRGHGQAESAPRGRFSRVRLGPHVRFASVEAGPLSLPALLALALGIGILTGLMGIGGGVLWLPALFYLVGQRTSAAAGTSLLLVWVSALLGSGISLFRGNVSWPLGAIMVAGGMLGSWYGTRIGLKMAGARLRFYFIYVVLAAMGIVAGKVATLMW